MLKGIKKLFKGETVFCVSLILAIISSFAVHPDKVWFTYPDYRTLALLFCLMIIVAGFKSLGVFEFFGGYLLKKAGNLRSVSIFCVVFHR